MNTMNDKQLERASVYFHGRDVELKTLLEAHARANNRSLSAEIVVTLWRGLEDRPCRKQPVEQAKITMVLDDVSRPIPPPMDKASHE
jgi:hypothetical protein